MHSDSGEFPVDGGDKTCKKRKLKTPIQVMALEKFYNEHKYPSEEMKAKLADEVGLTEKQVSGWFCHRRLKDKRSKDDGNNTIGGSQDRSSVVLQDRGSALRQDSCGSTKQNDYLNPKPLREVESQRLYGGSSYVGEEQEEEGDSTSSERSSSLHKVSSKDGVRDLENSRYVVARNDVINQHHHPQVTRSYGYGNNNKPSGYLKVKGEVENVAVTAVKRQLGRQYREDGPPLGLVFDPLPPAAFEPQTNVIVQEPIYVGVGNQRRSHFSYITGAKKSFNPPGKLKMHAPDPYSEDDDDEDDDDGDNITVGMEPGLKPSFREPRLKSPSNPVMLKETFKGLPREIPLTNSKKSRIISKTRPEGSRNNMIANYHNQTHDSYDKNVLFNGGSKSGYLAKSSKLLPLSSSRSLDSMERGLSSGMAGKYHGERNHIKTHREKLHSTDEPPVTKRVKHGYHLQQVYAPKSSHNEINRSSGMELNSSFSGDETAETSSSSMD